MSHRKIGVDNLVFETEAGKIDQQNEEKVEESENNLENYNNEEIGNDRHPKNKPMESPPWQPKCWCNHKFCPTFQKTMRLIAFVLIGLVLWYTLYVIVGNTMVPPKGQLFQIIIVSGSAMFAGWLVSLTNLPGLIGMLFIGALYQNCGIIDLDGSFAQINKFLRGIALIVILVRAGLGLDPSALSRLKFEIIKLGLLPWLIESIFVGILAYLFLDMPWSYGLALGFSISAISPAVTVPSLLRLKAKGYGVIMGIPTLVMAITTLTDVFSVVCFGIIQSFIFSTGTLTNLILQLPVSIIGGIGFGLIWGIICSYCPASHDSFTAPLRVLLILAGGILSVFGSDAVGFGGAGPLACVVAPYVAILSWTRQGWTLGENPVSISFRIFWMVFEPVLFAITGAQIKLNQLDGNVLLIGVGILLAGLLIRTILTVVLGIGSVFTLKEKIFSSLAMATKATVQAALAPVLIGSITDKTSPDYQHAERVMMINILSIILTTPPLAIFMDIFGPKILKNDLVKNRNEHRQSSLEMPPSDQNTEQ